MGGIDVALVLTNLTLSEVDHPPRCLVLFLTLFQSVNELLLLTGQKKTPAVPRAPRSSCHFRSFPESECKGTHFLNTHQILQELFSRKNEKSCKRKQNRQERTTTLLIIYNKGPE